MDYPTIEVQVDREKAGLAGLTPIDVSRALVVATSSSRFVVPNYWADPKSGIAYQVQVEVPRPVIRSPDDRVQTIKSADELGQLPVQRTGDGQMLVRDVSSIQTGSMPGQFDRYNMKRQVTILANFADDDLGNIAGKVQAAIKRAGAPPRARRSRSVGRSYP